MRKLTPELPTDAAEPIITAYREKVLYALAIVATVVLLPFAVGNLLKGFLLVGALSTTVVVIFVADAIAIYLRRPLPVPIPVAFSTIVVALLVAIWERGLLGIFWTFPAILLFHFVLERRTANLFNATLVALVAAVAFYTLPADVALRILAGHVLTLIFTNIFSFVVESEQAKETEQRRRLGVLVRATQAGFYQWDRGAAAVTYSGRLKEMLGHAADADTSGWPPFTELVHPEDRAHRLALFQAGARNRSVRNGVRRHVPGDFRMFTAGGGTIWVHSEGLFIHDAEGVAQRYIASLNDITDRVRQQEELRHSSRQIEDQAEQLKTQNAALVEAIRVREEVERIARHDLRTPLNSILAVPKMLRQGRQLDAQAEALLGVVESAAYRLLDMVNLSVDLYRMEKGEYRFSARRVDLMALAQTVARDVSAHADTKGVRIALSVDGAPPAPLARALAWGSELLCYSIVANLIKNAVEASPDGAVIDVAFATQDPDSVSLRIHNPGVVPEAVRDVFFEKYATAGKLGGFGLGTYSARLMAGVQGGALTMSTSEAQGTTLALRLPAAPRGSAADPADGGTRVDPSTGAHGPIRPMRVLVVDDDEFNLVFVRNALAGTALEVVTAINGRAAVDAVRARPFEAVLMDLEMPVMNGFDALARIREIEAQAGADRATVIAFSSYDDEGMRRRCREAGFDAYLSKPAPGERLLALLHAVAGGRELPEVASDPVAAPETPGPADAVRIDPDLAPGIEDFLRTRRELVDAMRTTLEDGVRDPAARARTRALAHKLAGSFALYGFAWAAQECRALQREADQGELPVLAERCRRLRAHLEDVRLTGGEGDGAATETAAGR